ncbi:MAG TPA: sulfite exporter TauE/SafE family protein [Mycobacteriales bacterium]|nr:sulfite exporter TauE/SafE family protein [Mycobacteriales bacterium]
MTATAVALGAVIGLLLGALGGGGSVLTVPALVLLLGVTAQEATTASLVVVGVTALAAAGGHARHGHLRWRAGVLVALAGIPASVAGSWANRAVDERVLLLAFAAVMVVAATGMLLRGGGAAPTVERSPGRYRWWRVVPVGLLVGALTGFLGVGGGFVVVPALVLVLRLPMTAAVGTSLLVIAANSAVALAARAGGPAPDWAVVAPFAAAAVVAALAGERVADRLPAGALSRVFAVLLLLVAGYVAVQAGLGLG